MQNEYNQKHSEPIRDLHVFLITFDMTPKEKADKLILKFNSQLNYDPKTYSHGLHAENSKLCALICVEEMIEITPQYTGGLNPKWLELQEVKKQIEVQ